MSSGRPPPTAPPNDDRPPPIWKRLALALFEGDWFKLTGLLFTGVNVVVLRLLFGVHAFDESTASLNGVLVAIGLLLAFAELSAGRRLLGDADAFPDLRSTKDRLLVGYWAVLLAASLILAVVLRFNPEKTRYEREAAEQRDGEEIRRLQNDPAVKAGAAAIQDWQQRAATNPSAPFIERRGSGRRDKRSATAPAEP